jgi:hypothetical protein
MLVALAFVGLEVTRFLLPHCSWTRRQRARAAFLAIALRFPMFLTSPGSRTARPRFCQFCRVPAVPSRSSARTAPASFLTRRVGPGSCLADDHRGGAAGGGARSTGAGRPGSERRLHLDADRGAEEPSSTRTGCRSLLRVGRGADRCQRDGDARDASIVCTIMAIDILLLCLGAICASGCSCGRRSRRSWLALAAAGLPDQEIDQPEPRV